jgi:hypothetical protein
MSPGQTHEPATGPDSIGDGHTQMPSTFATCGGEHVFGWTRLQVNVFFTNSVMPMPVIVIGEGGT